MISKGSAAEVGLARTTTDAATRQRLLREAAHQFARFGYDAASLRKIAERVGIRAATVYSHFPEGKAQLYEEILATVSSTLTERIAHRYGQNTGLSAEDVIVQMCAAFWDFCQEHPDYATLLLRETFDADNSRSWARGDRRARSWRPASTTWRRRRREASCPPSTWRRFLSGWRATCSATTARRGSGATCSGGRGARGVRENSSWPW